MHAERYIKRYPGQLPIEHTPRHVRDYATELGSRHGVKAWQYLQVLDALEILFR